MPAREMLVANATDTLIENTPQIKETGMEVSRAIHQTVMQGGEAARSAADVLHGKWLGHPLHPVLTDIVIGSWSLGAFFDLLSLMRHDPMSEEMADTLTGIGAVTAVPTAITGMTDYSTAPKRSIAYPTLHDISNSTALLLYILSLRARRSGNRGTGIALSALGFGIVAFSAWLGGEMVYKYRVGVNHTEKPSEPKEWLAVIADVALDEAEPIRIDVRGAPVLLYRKDGMIYATGAVCSHAGGPLEKGEFKGACVQCPWHDSVFNLSNGAVVHGPATYPVAHYQTRVVNGQIEIQLAPEQ